MILAAPTLLNVSTARSLHPDYNRKGLLAHIQQEFVLDWQGIHGANHWARVLHHGRAIARQWNADPLVVELFAFLHDSCRLDDWGDPKHGDRGAQFALDMQGQFYQLSGPQLDALCQAIRLHSDGHTSTNPTIQTCWDSDRLDLGRVGIRPSAKYLSELAATRIEIGYALSVKGEKLAY